MEFIWIDFLNSIWRDWRGTGKPSRDRLLEAEWRASFLNKWELESGLDLNEEDLERLTQLRAFLSRVTESVVSGGDVDEKDILLLNDYLQQSPVVRELVKSEDGWRMVFSTTQKGWSRVIEAIVTSFIHSLIEGHLSRVKICDNKDCLWVFYDATKNHSKRYCDDKMCGNLMKVRRFRERKKQQKK
jgi:predicted RNA-binding Zn ribbon-like protein